MHTFQLTAEDYGVQNDGFYADNASKVAAIMPNAGFKFTNPFDGSIGSNNAWVDVAAWTNPLVTGSTKAGVVAYSDSSGVTYQVAGRGKTTDFQLVLTSGE
jgi:hypothetical protein